MSHRRMPSTSAILSLPKDLQQFLHLPSLQPYFPLKSFMSILSIPLPSKIPSAIPLIPSKTSSYSLCSLRSFVADLSCFL
jgi:hypothetical protein